MTKILFITPRIDGTGGVQKSLSIRTRYLKEHYDYKVNILTTNSQSSQLFFDFSHIDVVDKKISGKGFFYFRNYLKVVKSQILEINPDIIVIVDNGVKGGLLPKYIKTPNNRVIYEQHGYRFYWKQAQSTNFFSRLKSDFFVPLINRSMKKVDKIVALVPATKKEWKTNNVVVIPNPLAQEYANLKKDYTTQKRVIAVGRHVVEKGFDMLIAIWAEVVKDFPDWQLDIYGHKDEALALDQMIKNLGLQNQVFLHKPTPEIRKKYLQADFYVMTSRHEGFGNVLVEAMACGLPCVAFDAPTGPGFIINNDENGYLVSCFDQKTYADKVKKLISNRELRIQMGQRAQQNTARFSLDKIMRKWDDLFSGLL